MSQQEESGFKTYTAGEDLAQFRRVRLSGTSDRTVVYADAGEVAVGVTTSAVDSGDRVVARSFTNGSTFKMTAGATMATRNALVYGAADGKVSGTVLGPAIGKQLDTASADASIIEVVITDDAAGDANYIYVDKSGHDTAGNGSQDNPYLTITAALAAVTSARKIIRVGPGEYEETTGLTWGTISGVQLIGVGNRWETVISAAAGDQVINVAPGAVSSTFELTIQNIQLDHDTSGQDGLLLNNTSMTKKLNCYLGNFGADGSASDKSVITNQGDTSNAIRIYWDGANGDIEGDVYLDAGNDGNRFYAENVHFAAGMETAADAVAFQIQLRYCGVLHEGVTGGNAAQTITTVGCFSKTGNTYAALDTNDLAGSHTESIISV